MLLDSGISRKVKKLEVYKKYKLYVEVIFKNGEFIINQKLNSFFGQVGIYEGAEKLTKFIDLYFKTLVLNSLNFGSNSDEYTFTDVIFHVPIVMYFYFFDKKCDFFVNNFFIKKIFYDKKRISSIFNFFKLKYFKDNFVTKKFFLNKLQEYLFLLKKIHFFYKNNSNFFNLLNVKSLNYLIYEDITYTFSNQIQSYIYLKKKKVFQFKKMLNKSRNNLLLFCKKMNWVSLKFMLNLIIYKFLFIKYSYKYLDFYSYAVSLLSHIYNIKNKFFKKFRRYKRFKKNVFRNFFGKKISYYKIYRYDKLSKKKNVKKG